MTERGGQGGGLLELRLSYLERMKMIMSEVQVQRTSPKHDQCTIFIKLNCQNTESDSTNLNTNCTYMGDLDQPVA